MRVRFDRAEGTYEGEAVILEWHQRRPSVRVWPRGWKHGIWIAVNEIVNPEDRSPAP